MKLVLAGAGYAHLLLLRDWHKQPLPGVKLTLISPFTHVPYTGLLPACIAGQYQSEDIHINVKALCERAGVKLLLDEVSGLDLSARRIQLSSQLSIAYDLLSLNTGPAADTSVPGVEQYSIPVKPASRFLPLWEQTRNKLRAADASMQLVMAGGGAGSMETFIAMAQAVQNDAAIQHKPRFTLLTASTRFLPSYPASVAKAALQRCKELGINVLTGKRISRVETATIYMQDSFNQRVPFDELFWCTAAAAPTWLKDSGLACNEAGFLKIAASLQSMSDACIFATGDVAAFVQQALPKAGVFAVRQAPVLNTNLRQAAQHKPLIAFKPQKYFLSLLTLGEDTACGSYGPLAFSGRWVRNWKARIDQRFMDSFK